MLTDLELESMRSTSQAALPDEGTITRPAVAGTLNTATADWTPSAPTLIYEGPVRVRPPTAAEVTVLFGDEQVTRQRFVATLPHDAAEPKIGDRLTLAKSTDPTLVERPLRVTVVSAGSFHIDRRCGLEVIE